MLLNQSINRFVLTFSSLIFLLNYLSLYTIESTNRPTPTR